MQVPVITGDGTWVNLDSDDMARLIVAEACDAIDPHLWEWLTEEEPADKS